MRKIGRWSLTALFTTLLVWSVQPAHALEKGDYLFRLGAAHVAPIDDSSNVGSTAGSGVGVDSAATLGFTVGRMMTDNLAVELFGIIPSNHDLEGEGTVSSYGNFGDVDVFPPTLSLNYYFMTKSNIRPHVGLGISGTLYWNAELTDGFKTNTLGDSNAELDVDNTVGFGGNIGVDIDITDKMMFSLSLIYINLDADATITTKGTEIGVDIDVNPLVSFAAIGVKF